MNAGMIRIVQTMHGCGDAISVSILHEYHGSRYTHLGDTRLDH